MRRLTSDIGFFEPDLARAVVGQMVLKMASKDARSTAEALRDLMRKRVEAVRGDGSAAVAHGGSLSRADLQRGIDIGAISKAERDALREDKLLESVELFLQLLDEFDVGLAHGLFSLAGAEKDKGDDDSGSLSTSHGQIDTGAENGGGEQ